MTASPLLSSCRENPVLKHTPLHAVHRAAGARMVDFGGWDMPVHYGSQIEEHHAVRTDAGMFDVSHMRVVDLEGARGARLPPLRSREQRRQAGGPRQGAVLVPAHAGGYRHRRSDRLLPARGFLPARRQRGHRRQGHRLVSKAHRRACAGASAHAPRGSRDDRRAGTQRPREGLEGAAGQRGRVRGSEAVFGDDDAIALGEAFIARTGYTGEDGFEIVLAAARAGELWVALVGGRRASLRVSARATRCVSKPG